MCSYSYDSFKAWWAQNQGSFLAGMTGQLTGAGATGLVALATVANPVAGLVGAGISIFSAVTNALGTVGDKNKDAQSPNVYGDALKDAFFKLFDEKGYEDMCPSEKVIYLQPGYLKFGRTKGHNTSIRLPKLNLDAASDINVEFDFAAMIQGDGTVDDVKLVVVVEGDGEFANGTKYSDLITRKMLNLVV